MKTNGMTRAELLAAIVAAGLTATSGPAIAQTSAIRSSHERVDAALVLGGGGARGAYQAGIVEGMRRRAGVGDGERIPGIDVVCGTSIGSINGWFVATAQYAKLHDLWANVASEDVFVLKRRFAAVEKPGAFIVDRIIAAISLAQGLTKNVRGILDGDKIDAWLRRHVDPRMPLVVPFVFTATDLDRRSTTLFYRLPFTPSSTDRQSGIERLRSTVGKPTQIFEARDELLISALHASAAIPILFDPVELPLDDPIPDRYVDGGIADNDPIDAARALARTLYAPFTDPADPKRDPNANAAEIGVASFEVAQERILEESLRSAYLETRQKRLFAGDATNDRQRDFEATIYDADLFTIRPSADLSVQVVDFDRQDLIDAAYAEGLRDIATGWIPYAPVV